MIKEAIQKIQEMVRDEEPAVRFHDDGAMTHFLITSPDGTGRHIAAYDNAEVIQHSMWSLPSLVSFLNGPLASDVTSGAVFVSNKEVYADLAYANRHKQRVSQRTVQLPLSDSPEMWGLGALIRGVGQKDLWRLLVTKLHKAMAPELLLQIGKIKIAAKGEDAIDIQLSGVESGSSSTAVAVAYGDPKMGPQNAEIGLDWTWKGRVWTQFNKEYEIKLRLEVTVVEQEKTRSLKFTFHAVDLEEALEAARLDLVNELQHSVDTTRFNVYDGTF